MCCGCSSKRRLELVRVYKSFVAVTGHQHEYAVLGLSEGAWVGVLNGG